jgi:hypothetical protein
MPSEKTVWVVRGIMKGCFEGNGLGCGQMRRSLLDMMEENDMVL